mmetsp:Transcript_12389/g.28575  ORF Transcript_12389/g.28575 Transcript_12389/m.28575 type:complete len:200 (-) Transcript_12389:560-1159(-)
MMMCQESTSQGRMTWTMVRRTISTSWTRMLILILTTRKTPTLRKIQMMRTLILVSIPTSSLKWMTRPRRTPRRCQRRSSPRIQPTSMRPLQQRTSTPPLLSILRSQSLLSRLPSRAFLLLDRRRVLRLRRCLRAARLRRQQPMLLELHWQSWVWKRRRRLSANLRRLRSSRKPFALRSWSSGVTRTSMPRSQLSRVCSS